MQDTELSRVRKFESFEDQTTAKQTGVSRSQARTNNLTARVFWGTLIVFFSAAITASSLLLVVLVDKTAQESGIATLTVNVSSLPEPTTLFHRSQAFEDDIFQPLASDIHSFSGEVSTAVGNIASEVATVAGSAQTIVGSAIQSAETAVATALQNATQTFFNTSIPRSLSFGTESLCISYANDTMECASLPFNLTQFLPSVVSELFDNRISSLQQLGDLVGKVLAIFRSSLIAGIASVLILGSIIFFLCRYLLFVRLWIRLLIVLVIGVACLVPFIILAAMIVMLQRKLSNIVQDDLSPLLYVHVGKVGSYVLAALCCAVVMFVAAIAALFV